jgi:hypothetical protein
MITEEIEEVQNKRKNVIYVRQIPAQETLICLVHKLFDLYGVKVSY